jgi:hypothetical protein
MAYDLKRQPCAVCVSDRQIPVQIDWMMFEVEYFFIIGVADFGRMSLSASPIYRKMAWLRLARGKLRC